jgi:hydrogenase maturation factor
LAVIVEQASATAAEVGVDIVGGHTEISDSVNRFVVTTTAFGTVWKTDCVRLDLLYRGYASYDQDGGHRRLLDCGYGV